jgi:predicted dehydrogenase
MINLSPEEKKKGREAFAQCSRRDFLKSSAVAVGVPTASLGAFYFGYDKTHGDPVRVGVLGTGDEGNVLLGAINPEYIDVRAIADLRPYNQWRAFHGDHYSPAALAARPGLMSVYGWKTEDEARKHVKVFTRYEDLLDQYVELGIEAVIIALPLHLHAPAAVKAAKLGLHVLTEKLMGHSVANCKEMARAAKEANIHLATGHQRHYNILYHEAVEMIKRRQIGDLHFIRAQWHRNNNPNSDSWQQPMPPSLKPDDKLYDRLHRLLATAENSLYSARGAAIEEASILVQQRRMQLEDYVLADGGTSGGTTFLSAEEAGYNSENIDGYDRPAAEELIRWRLWQRTGGGLMVELGSHQLDASGIFISAYHNDGEKKHPLSVLVAANRPLFPNDRQVMDHVACVFEYAGKGYDPNTSEGRKDKIGVQYSTINGNGYQGYGEVVYGTEGTLILEKEQDSQLMRGDKASRIASKSGGGGPSLDTQASGPAQKAVDTGGPANVSRGYREQEEHWAWCIRVNPKNKDEALQPRCHPKVALADAVISLTTNIAAHMGDRVQFKDSWFDPESDDTPEFDLQQLPNSKPDMSREMYEL